MTETTPDAKGPAPVQLTPETAVPAPISADEVKPEDVGTLSIEYRDSKPVIVVSGGKYLPAGLMVVNESGPVAMYKAELVAARVATWPTNLIVFDNYR
ncbi:hypothetical protein OG393_31710 [Streptomyces sp. NBC_01216]|uniref:hypothetical protein n=1 Tax=Streptomyces sp. NBC_01216 TaxID=2903778 RepID=UPI002E124C1A|nr:hypothetical protein OG393_20605 [Streptomyces sp. NBC_01216]WSQ67860.1 hypothetical protein OG393_26080 [Streptomyces sp. NBC_01216]WSQ68864.1 hypothetical protein OG393_31710 [Streptomyces sp. NBC_01216]